MMTDEADLIHRLTDAHRRSARDVDPAPYAVLDRAAAYRVQHGVTRALGADVGMLKTGVHPDGVGVVAAIFAANVGHAPDYRLAARAMTGLEVEVGLVLARDIKTSADVPGAIDHFFVGVEICGWRYSDRAAAGLNGALADSVSALGYCIGPRRANDAIDGLTIRIEHGGREIYAAPAKHGFGTVLASLVAYADVQQPSLPLKAGTIVTTGSMCGLVPASGAGSVVAHLGDERVSFELI